LTGNGNDDGPGAELFLAQPETCATTAGARIAVAGRWQGRLASGERGRIGIVICGEQRGLRGSDYDGDGRVDLVVAQSNDQTRLLHNLRAATRLR